MEGVLREDREGSQTGEAAVGKTNCVATERLRGFWDNSAECGCCERPVICRGAVLLRPFACSRGCERERVVARDSTRSRSRPQADPDSVRSSTRPLRHAHTCLPAFASAHWECRMAFSDTATFVLYVRSHALRMPLQHCGMKFVQHFDKVDVLVVHGLHAHGIFFAPSQ